MDRKQKSQVVIASKIRGGNKRPQTFRTCKLCGIEFGPLERLTRKFCSYKCKVADQSTGRLTFRKTIPKARSAQSLLRYHIQAGNIQRPTKCEECAVSGFIEGAHKDYDRPLDVRWLCRSCHRKWDKQSPKNATIITGKKAELING